MSAEDPSLLATSLLPRRAPGILATVRAPDPDLADRLLGQRLKASLFGEPPTPVCIGAYQLLGKIGAGGMGVVYRARDPALERSVALKVIHPDLVGAAERIRREARALARLAHPNIVTVFEVGDHEGHLFVAMEHIDGVTLRAWCEQARISAPPAWRSWLGAPVQGRLRAVLEHFLQAARGLRAAHAAGLVHCDFKPENVLVGGDGRVRVVDFGIASPAGAAAVTLTDTDAIELTTRTVAGELVGTPAYMAPEQLRGQPIDARADQFAFCIALHEAIAGRRPFAGDTFAALVDAVTQDRRDPLPRWLPAPLRALIARGLAPAPADRFPDMQALVDALERLLHPPIRRQLALAASAGFALTFAAIALLPAPATPPPRTLVTDALQQTPTHCLTPTQPPTAPSAYQLESQRRAALLAAATPDSLDFDRGKADLLALQLARGNLDACKTVAMTQRSRPDLPPRSAADLRCLWTRHCAARPDSTCPDGLHAAGVGGCRPTARCSVRGLPAQADACLAGDGACCFSALTLTRFQLERSDATDDPHAQTSLRALAEAGCTYGHAELCITAGTYGMDPGLARRRACELHHLESCAP